MLYKVIETEESRLDFLELVEFYENISQGLSNRIISEYFEILDTLSKNPNHYFKINSNYRRILFKKFHCGVFNKIKGNIVEIVSVKDMRIHPEKFPKL
jgi:hypothetical protein